MKNYISATIMPGIYIKADFHKKRVTGKNRRKPW